MIYKRSRSIPGVQHFSPRGVVGMASPRDPMWLPDIFVFSCIHGHRMMEHDDIMEADYSFFFNFLALPGRCDGRYVRAASSLFGGV